MTDVRERRGYNSRSDRLLTLNLEDRLERQEEREDVPLKLTEERIRSEWEHGVNAHHRDTAPLLIEPPVAPQYDAESLMSADLSRGNSPAASAPPAPSPRPYPRNRPAQTGSVLRLDETPAAPAARPSGSWKLVRKSRSSRRGPWTAVLVLSLALGSVIAYGYLALQRNSVIVSELPGAATVRVLRVEAADAEEQARPAVVAAAQRVEQAAGYLRDRYEGWRARH